jgi:2-hydroxy-3-oxopropionate reductase
MRRTACPRASRPPWAVQGADEITRRAEVVFVMVPDTPDVEAVLFGARGVAAGCRAAAGARKVVVDMSSISPTATKALRAPHRRARRRLRRRAGLGRRGRAPRRRRSPSCAAATGGVREGRPLLEKMGKNITLVGGNGDGQTTKVANQIIVALNIAAVGEALLFASKAGADPGQGAAGADGRLRASRILEVHGERMIKRTFQPGFRIRCTRRT